MIQREQELFEQIADAIKDNHLPLDDRLDLLFSALFELDKIQKGQRGEYSEELLKEVTQEAALKELLKQIADTAETEDTNTRIIRSILMFAKKNPEIYGLSIRFKLFIQKCLANTSLENEKPVEMNTIQLKQEWIAKKLHQIQDLGEDAVNAQLFVDELRKGNFFVASRFANWVVKKYNTPELNPKTIVLGVDNLHPLIAYELAYTDISPKDIPAVLMMFDNTSGLDQYDANLILSGISNLTSELAAINKRDPDENALDAMKVKHGQILRAQNPVNELIEHGLIFDDQVDLGEHYESDKVTAFSRKNRNRITANLILLNRPNASLNEIETVMSFNHQINEYLDHLEANPPENPQDEYYNNRVNAAYKMLESLQKSGTVYDGIIPNLITQSKIIATNKPTPWEVEWLRKSRELITTQLILLNTWDAHSEHNGVLVAIQKQLIRYIHRLETEISDAPDLHLETHLKLAYDMLAVLQQRGSIKEVVIPEIIAIVHEIAQTHPKDWEIDWLRSTRDSLTANFMGLNTDQADFEDDNEKLLELKNKIISYLDFLENNPPEKLQQTYANRVIAAYKMLEVLQLGGKVKEDIIPRIKAQAQIISQNKPGIPELGFLGWLQSFFDYFKKPMALKTSIALEEIDQIVKFTETKEPANHDLGQENKDISMEGGEKIKSQKGPFSI